MVPSPGARGYLELLGEAHRDGSFERGVARYPSIGDRVVLVTANDLSLLYRVEDEAKSLRIGHVANAPLTSPRRCNKARKQAYRSRRQHR